MRRPTRDSVAMMASTSFLLLLYGGIQIGRTLL